MDQFKKMRSKLFKRSSKPKQHRDPELRHSRSLPLRNSNDTGDSYQRTRPIYRSQLQFSDVQQVFDISPEKPAIYDNPHGGWHQSCNDNEYDELSDTEGPYRHEIYPVIDKAIVYKFPLPPMKTPLPKGAGVPKRPARPPTLDLVGYQFEEADLLPDMDPIVKAKLDAMARKEALPEQAIRARAGPPLTRSASSASRYTPPLQVRRNGNVGHGAPSSLSVHDSAGIYRNPLASNSTRSLDPNASLATSRPGLASAAYPGSHLMYNHAVAMHSLRSLGANARYHAALADGNDSDSDSVYSDSANPVDPNGPTTVRRRNASFASSRSALSARRNAHEPPPKAAVPAPPTAHRHQSLGPNHPAVARAVNGPGGMKVVFPGAERLGLDAKPSSVMRAQHEMGVAARNTRPNCGAATVSGVTGRGARTMRH
ncbi:hypothetical protein H0H81_011350 [Sphagnurus paluster]|uniref:Uncharacterized protein n=1 Tax=Sphagnurus paluster TaxID=117069 RepID=A0A9P7FWU6_9AGAR|nr:hypothetical protein H0H81_011350 [Sphagnurus paluster]